MTNARKHVGTALIIGATGGVGSATAKALISRGWTVRALHRDPAAARRRMPGLTGVEWIRGDAMNREDVVAAADGCILIVHGANPPGYRNWRGLAVPMLENAIEAAKVAEARLVFPGNLYNFGRDSWPVVNENTPQRPTTRKGRIRVEMEQMLRRAASDDGVRVLIVRAGDFFGSNAPGSWLPNVMIKPGRPIRSITYPGRPGTGHAWAYLPDVAETIVRIAEREADLSDFEIFHFGGHYFDRGIDFAHAVARVGANDGSARIRRLPWAALYLVAPFSRLVREVLEMRYLWQVTLRLDNSRLVRFLGEEPHTPLEPALAATLAGLGCLGEDRAGADTGVPNAGIA